MKKELSTRIIGGKYKGKKLLLPQKEVTRSSKNILREALFNILQFDIVDKNFVEVFGGSGSVGLEALSRGAKRVYFIEKNRDSYKVLKKNVQNCDESSCLVRYGDAFELLWDIIEELKRNKEKAYFYFDPPFSIREGYEDIYDEVAQTIKKIPKEVVESIIIEHMSTHDFGNSLGKYNKEKTKKYGKSSLSFYQ
ncbi:MULTISPECIES: 16S rRNA (guanine(966)-N(2))-methyltransferase RsmD [unclassified Nitratiruptor]|uniref:16S rRNA (guanine(966)-N(2))-methyltransferase RsmD n=1 Tax=unclassified Nitratiruptor TaxID=2624044 RepID=UPI001914DE37|nr:MULTISPECIES: 16S rRNA (guanine(966)-N(2))-methyltransferase RsmD [unclassified Nitratiruptor]BCD60288.1 16S rRNA (guanine(966)-N(2))-methyltransferase [Nitratiruptor sp. YY08-10]BCD64223.1 16S rRNA (guanine(966)-N(2))-methyltransferase [Nitratiruptor sp. YY08-14]